MGSIVEGVKTVNSTLRTVLLAILVGAGSYAGYLVYNEYTQHDRLVREQEEKLLAAQQQLGSLQEELQGKVAQVEELTTEVRQQSEHIDRLETAMHLLKTDQRLASLRVVDIQRDEEGKAVTSTLEFVELSPQGDAISAPKSFELPGDVVYIDNWVVKFDDKYIEKGDVERGTSLCLFRRIFSEDQVPTAGIMLDEVGMRPQAYSRGGKLTKFEKELWSDFWEFANDGDKAQQLGIRAANGEAVSIQVREGKTYHVTLRASGGLSIKPVDSIATEEAL